MDFQSQLKTLFKPPARPHSPNAELSVRTGHCSEEKDFKWLETNIPCQKACPAGTDIPSYLTAIAEDDPEKAYAINLRDNIFPAVLGRVCSRPCETACRHGYEGLGDPVSICFSKRSAADFKNQSPRLLEPWFGSSGKKVAIIGAGVAGLTVARNLKLLGHEITVYEKHGSPGGMLNQGIPEFRLPRNIIEREIEQVTALGVEIICNTDIGKSMPLQKLLTEFDSVVIAAGTLQPNLPDIPGKHLPGIRHGLDFLLEVNETGSADIGEHVVIIGGGFTAMDCARTAKRLGAASVELADHGRLKVMYRRAKNDMRVTPGELEELKHEEIPLECHATPVAYLEENKILSGMRFLRTGTKEEFEIPVDTVLLATGQVPDTTWLNKAGLENIKSLFYAGDFSLGATTLIDAIAHAKDAAYDVDRFLMGIDRLQDRVHVEEATLTGRTQEMDAIPQQSMPTLPLSGRTLSAEVEQGFDPTSAIEEAERCYRCHYKFEIDQDKCIKCDWCLKARPRPECILMLKKIDHDDGGRAVAWEATESMREMNLIWINQDECIRCGACIKACPVDAINLQKVSLSTEPVIGNTVRNSEDSS